jgi:hypothetical protein
VSRAAVAHGCTDDDRRRVRTRFGGDAEARAWHRDPMEDRAVTGTPADLPTDDLARRRPLDERRATLDVLQQDTARVSVAIAATERAVAATLRVLAADDRERGRTAAADRREARALDAERFAARESAAADDLTGRARSTSTATDADDRR